MIDLDKIIGFDWNRGNQDKNADKHGVAPKEAEQVFGDDLLLLFKDVLHSGVEDRFAALGKTLGGRLLYVTFTLRGNGTLIRVISARDADKRERGCYD